MSPRPTRRGFLGLTGRTAAVAAAGASLPALGAGTASAVGARLPAVTHPHHPAALYPEDFDDSGDAPGEPLNAGVECGAERVG